MTGPHDPNHDLPERVPVVLPVFDGEHLSFSGECSTSPAARVVLPFGWGPLVDPGRGVMIGHAVRTDLPRFGPTAVLHLAITKQLGFKLA